MKKLIKGKILSEDNKSRFSKWKEKCREKLRLKSRLEHFNNRYLKCTLIEAVVLNYAVEAMSRHSILKPVVYLFRSPIMFLYNTMLLFFLLGLGAIFRRRILYAGIMSVAIFALGLTNGVLLLFRTTPFAAVDLTLIKSAWLIVDLYLPPFVVILIIVALVAIIVACVFAGFKAPKYTGKMMRIPFVIGAAVYLLSMVGMDSILVQMGVSTTNYSNLANAYLNYGFPYCFSNSIFKLGMEKPDNYSPEAVEQILNEKINEDEENQSPENGNNTNGDTNGNTNGEVNGNGNGEAGDGTEAPNGGATGEATVGAEGNIADEKEQDVSTPNIIFVQLESFFDVEEVAGLELSEDPIPNFRYLKDKFTSGYLFVPSVGAGTANTEFEVITGMNMDFFGPGEYPYKTILKSTTCESAAYDLQDLGYATHVIHNNDGTFYDRHIVFSQLGFDTFTPIEYMYDFDRNVNGFAEDEILVKEIMDTLESTEEQDYIYTITVQSHGEYSNVRLGEPQPIFLRYTDEDMENAWSYYVNQIYEVDKVVGEIVEEIYAFDEPTVVVFYGDHLPNLGLTNDVIASGKLTATEYVMWSNYELPQADRDVEAYQLTSYVLGQAGISHGVMIKFHQKTYMDENYLEELELLQYDMLYGDREVYDGMNPYIASELQMGIREIKINSVAAEEDGSIYVRGSYFNEYSVVYCNNSAVSTTYIDANTLRISGVTPKEGDVFRVAQVGTDNYALGYTTDYVYATKAE